MVPPRAETLQTSETDNPAYASEFKTATHQTHTSMEDSVMHGRGSNTFVERETVEATVTAPCLHEVDSFSP